jgi:hypothetical protein
MKLQLRVLVLRDCVLLLFCKAQRIGQKLTVINFEF